ncbi:ribonuclease J [Bacillus tropicus]|uniref:ribonuclease J n=1 Tax=Bacillus tropicus TaxID=2026188 RepID=UPI001CFEFFC7|nr:ribonuclease J [Bacillus tropicus]USK98538.1 ribonuclease J [Bacillus tropicus]
MKSLKNNVSIVALGGVNEIGKNMYVIQSENDIVVIDCGSKFPDESLLGIDLIIPDVTYLQENKEKIRGLVVTHGHEDHIGGIPYFLKQLNVPIYATKLTLGLIEIKLKEHNLQDDTELIVIHSESEIDFGAIKTTFFKTNHSIPDCLGIVFHTPEGTIVHTGDFKFDLTPVNNQHPDIHKMAKIGSEGVLTLISESTNAERPGFTPSERSVGERIEEIFMKANRKVIISTFASNVNRVQQIVEACIKTNRKLALLGRSMVNVVEVALEKGYLNIPDGMLIEANEVNRLDPKQVAILCTGSQGEPMAALARLASGNYRQVDVLPEDTVIIAATPIPGNERNVSRIIDNLFALGAKVIYGSGSSTGVHVSGHAYQEELKLMLTLMKPKYFIPIHGEFRMLYHHSLLAESIGVEKENIFMVRNGDVVDISNQVAIQSRKIQAGNIYVDGLGIGDVGNALLRDRKQLSEDGMLVIVITFNKVDGEIISGPDIISRGFVYVRDSEEFLKELNKLAVITINNVKKEKVNSWGILKREVREALGKYIYTSTKRKPMILPIIIEV